MPTTISIPMALVTVGMNTGNTYWAAKSGSQVDDGHVRYVDGGLGRATYWMVTPRNIDASEAWTLDIHHHADSGAGGNVVLSAFAQASTGLNILDANTTLLVASSAYNADSTMTITRLSGGNFDSVVGLSANTYLRVILIRSGNDGSDTVGADWNLNSINWIGDIS